MRIALIRREYIIHLDGVNKFIAWLAEGLYKLGHELTVLSLCFKGDVSINYVIKNYNCRTCQKIIPIRKDQENRTWKGVAENSTRPIA